MNFIDLILNWFMFKIKSFKYYKRLKAVAMFLTTFNLLPCENYKKYIIDNSTPEIDLDMKIMDVIEMYVCWEINELPVEKRNEIKTDILKPKTNLLLKRLEDGDMNFK